MDVHSRKPIDSPEHRRRRFLGWLTSWGLHLALVVILSLLFRATGPRGGGLARGPGDAGIIVLDGGGGGQGGDWRGGDQPVGDAGSRDFRAGPLDSVSAIGGMHGSPEAVEIAPTPAGDPESASFPVEDEPPIRLDQPGFGPPPIGTGNSLRQTRPGAAVPDLVRGSSAQSRIGAGRGPRGANSGYPGSGANGTGGTGAGDGPNGAGSGKVAFFGSGQLGTRFVFVVDASASMHEHNASRVAKAELLSSISQIGVEQEFQILFYNEEILPMTVRGHRSSLFTGGEVNRNLAEQYIRSVQPGGGTRHREALLEALKLRPDVIFFLTDAGEPWLTAADLAEVRRRNAQRCRICVVEFGKGNPLSNTDAYWTRRLAHENTGSYAYKNIVEFDRRP